MWIIFYRKRAFKVEQEKFARQGQQALLEQRHKQFFVTAKSEMTAYVSVVNGQLRLSTVSYDYAAFDEAVAAYDGDMKCLTSAVVVEYVEKYGTDILAGSKGNED